jgi:N-methylhydantoinase A
LRVGPLSAGADPGPACYGNGDAPTVTDANVVLRRLEPARAARRRVSDRCRRVRATRSRAVAAPLGGDVERTAAGIVTLVDAEMAKVLRIVSVERGHDPRDFTLLAFGGGGPLHACAVAADIGVARRRPASPGRVLRLRSAGRRRARRRAVRSLVAPADDETWRARASSSTRLARESDAALAEQGRRPKAIARSCASSTCATSDNRPSSRSPRRVRSRKRSRLSTRVTSSATASRRAAIRSRSSPCG